MASQRTILLAEDDPLLLDALSSALEERGYCVVPVADGRSAIAAISDRLPDLAVLDMLLPGKSGFQVCAAIEGRANGRTGVVMMSEHASSAHSDYAYAAGVDFFLPKPFAIGRLLEVVESLCPPLPTARIKVSPATTQAAAMGI